jgi:hypothetical protein
MTRFSAPWGRGLKWTSALSTLMCIALAAYALLRLPPAFLQTTLLWTLTPLLLVPLGALLFVVKGYTVHPSELIIHRLFWDTCFPLAGLRSADAVPNAMRGSMRLWGNGGLFCFTGRYWSRSLGHYRAFVNDWQQCVVLRLADKTIVLSTDDPEGLIRCLPTPP